MFSLILLACTPADDDGFLSAGGRYENSSWGSTDTADTAADTGEDDEPDEGAPVITGEELEWTEYPNYGMVLQIRLTFTDEGDDIEGGTMYLDVFQPGDEIAYAGILEIIDIADVEEVEAGAVYLYDSETLFCAIDNLDETEDTYITVELKDASKNLSATYEYAIDGD